jgi:transcriptional regulator with XRE-family HTH domain
MIVSAQCRAARAWLDWSQSDLAEQSNVSRRAIAEFERGSSVPHDRTLRDLLETFRENGIEMQFDGPKAVGIRVSAENSSLVQSEID